MENDVLKEILTLQRESNERDAKIETSLDYMEKRIASMEVLTAKMSETLNEQKHLSSIVDNLANQIIVIKNQFTKIENKINAKNYEPAIKAYEVFKKIAWVIVSAMCAAFAGYLVFKIKTIWNGAI